MANTRKTTRKHCVEDGSLRRTINKQLRRAERNEARRLAKLKGGAQ